MHAVVNPNLEATPIPENTRLVNFNFDRIISALRYSVESWLTTGPQFIDCPAKLITYK